MSDKTLEQIADDLIRLLRACPAGCSMEEVLGILNKYYKSDVKSALLALVRREKVEELNGRYLIPRTTINDIMNITSELRVYKGRARELGYCNSCQNPVDPYVFVIQLASIQVRVCWNCGDKLWHDLRDECQRKATFK